MFFLLFCQHEYFSKFWWWTVSLLQIAVGQEQEQTLHKDETLSAHVPVAMAGQVLNSDSFLLQSVEKILLLHMQGHLWSHSCSPTLGSG